MDSKEQVKLKFGFYIVADIIKKGLVVYILAALLGVFLKVLIVHFSFLFLRQVTYGWHSRTNKGCILGSVFVFVIFPYAINLVDLSATMVYGSSLIVIASIYLIGPIGTLINPIQDEKKLLKNKLLIRLFLLLIFMCVIPLGVFQYILVGVTIQLTTLLIQSLKNGGVKYG